MDPAWYLFHFVRFFPQFLRIAGSSALLSSGVTAAFAACTTFGTDSLPREEAGTVPTGTTPTSSSTSPPTTDGSPDVGRGDASGPDGQPTLDGAAPRTWRYVFLSSEPENGGFKAGGLLKADDLCAMLAKKGLPVVRTLTWVAWMSTNLVDAKNRVGAGASPEYRLPNGNVVFSAMSFGTGVAPLLPIRVDENGKDLGTKPVWTGTQPSGVATQLSCNNWSSAAEAVTGTIGSSDSITVGYWTLARPSTQKCNDAAHVYCFEKP